MSTSESGKYALLDQLAEEFAERWRRGERPSLAEYLDRYPDLADDIQELFPAMAEIEQAEGDRREVVEPVAAPPLQMMGDYRILREIGHGGMGIVYEAEQVSLGRHVALKVLPHQTLADPRQRRRFEREARTAARLHHTNIVPIFGVGEHEGQPYFVMQFIQGLGLDEVIKALQQLRTGREGEAPAEPAAAGPSPREVTAADMARSLLTGAFHPAADITVDAVPVAVQAPPSSASETSPVGRLSDSLTLSSSSATLAIPGGDAHPAKKQTYWQQVANLGMHVADALDHAHKQGVLHRDIKPSNLLLDTHGTVWVTDFGLAKADDHQNLTQTGDVVGTLRYMPPEAFEGKTDARSDLYALGLTLYEMLAFHPAFDAQDRPRLIKQVMARRISMTERLGRWAGRNKLLAAALAAVVLLGVTITVGSIALAAHFRRQEAVQRGLVQEKGELAERNRQLADENRSALETAKTSQRETETLLLDMQTARGLQAAERDAAALAALWFATAAEQATSDPRRQADNRLRARNWVREAVLPVSAVSLPGPPHRLMEFRPGGDLLLLGAGTNLFIWDMRQDRYLPWADGRLAVTAACWSPDGATLALALGQQVQIRSVPDGTILHQLHNPEVVTALAWSSDGLYLAVANNVVRFWFRKPQVFLQPHLRHLHHVTALAFNGKGNRLVTACQDQMARGFAFPPDPGRPEPLFAVPHSPRDPSAPALVDHDRGLVTITGQQQLTWWDAERGKEGFSLRFTTNPKDLSRVVASRDGQWFATGGTDRGQVWSVADRGKKSLLLAQGWLDQAQQQPNVSGEGQEPWNRMPWYDQRKLALLRREAEQPMTKPATPGK